MCLCSSSFHGLWQCAAFFFILQDRRQLSQKQQSSSSPGSPMHGSCLKTQLLMRKEHILSRKHSDSEVCSQDRSKMHTDASVKTKPQ